MCCATRLLLAVGLSEELQSDPPKTGIPRGEIWKRYGDSLQDHLDDVRVMEKQQSEAALRVFQFVKSEDVLVLWESYGGFF